MESNNSTKYLIAVIFILVIGFSTSMGYIIGNLNSHPNNSFPLQYTNEVDVLKEVERFKKVYDSEIDIKNSVFNELKAQKLKTEVLIQELEKSKSDAESLMKYKTHYQELEAKMRILVAEITELKNVKSSAVKNFSKRLSDSKNKINKGNVASRKKVLITKNNIDKPIEISTPIVPISTSSKSSASIVKNEIVDKKQLENEVLKKEDYRITDLNVGTYVSRSGDQTKTNVASKADFIRLVCNIKGSFGEGVGEKTFYVQIINGKNNVIGSKITEYLEGKTLTYSYSKTIAVSGGVTYLKEDLYQTKFEKGIYFINVFDKSKLVASTSITLE